MPSKKPRKKKRPIGRILHSAMALTGRNSYISPEPKRCVERKVLNCLARIIAQIVPRGDDSLPNLRTDEFKPSLLLPWKEPTCPLPDTVASRKNVTQENEKCFRRLPVRYHSQMMTPTIKISINKPTRNMTSTVQPTFRHKLRQRIAWANAATEG